MFYVFLVIYCVSSFGHNIFCSDKDLFLGKNFDSENQNNNTNYYNETNQFEEIDSRNKKDQHNDTNQLTQKFDVDYFFNSSPLNIKYSNNDLFCSYPQQNYFEKNKNNTEQEYNNLFFSPIDQNKNQQNQDININFQENSIQEEHNVLDNKKNFKFNIDDLKKALQIKPVQSPIIAEILRYIFENIKEIKDGNHKKTICDIIVENTTRYYAVFRQICFFLEEWTCSLHQQEIIEFIVFLLQDFIETHEEKLKINKDKKNNQYYLLYILFKIFHLLKNKDNINQNLKNSINKLEETLQTHVRANNPDIINNKILNKDKDKKHKLYQKNIVNQIFNLDIPYWPQNQKFSFYHYIKDKANTINQEKFQNKKELSQNCKMIIQVMKNGPQTFHFDNIFLRRVFCLWNTWSNTEKNTVIENIFKNIALTHNFMQNLSCFIYHNIYKDSNILNQDFGDKNYIFCDFIVTFLESSLSFFKKNEYVPHMSKYMSCCKKIIYLIGFLNDFLKKHKDIIKKQYITINDRFSKIYDFFLKEEQELLEKIKIFFEIPYDQIYDLSISDSNIDTSNDINFLQYVEPYFHSTELKKFHQNIIKNTAQKNQNLIQKNNKETTQDFKQNFLKSDSQEEEEEEKENYDQNVINSEHQSEKNNIQSWKNNIQSWEDNIQSWEDNIQHQDNLTQDILIKNGEQKEDTYHSINQESYKKLDKNLDQKKFKYFVLIERHQQKKSESQRAMESLYEKIMQRQNLLPQNSKKEEQKIRKTNLIQELFDNKNLEQESAQYESKKNTTTDQKSKKKTKDKTVSTQKPPKKIKTNPKNHIQDKTIFFSNEENFHSE